MRTEIHPDYEAVTIRCSCGNEIHTRSTSGDQTVELCSECHPFYTGKQKLVDTGGRIDRFERRYGRRKKAGGESTEAPEDTATAADAAAPSAQAAPAESPAATESSTQGDAEGSES